MEKPIKHQPFDSIYREKFEVVEEHKHHTRLYPHTEQLPLLSRAINFDFYDALPERIASTDHRGDSTRKLLLHVAAFWYCAYVNLNRRDQVRLFVTYTPELVSKIGIIQQITSSESRGGRHRFRLFTGANFLPDVHLSGKRLSFASHVFDRAATRIPTGYTLHPVDLLRMIWRSVAIVARAGKSPVLLFDYYDSFIALPVIETEDEYFVTTCLTPREINTLEFDEPAPVLRFHHGPDCVRPTKANFNGAALLAHFKRCWSERKPIARRELIDSNEMTWHQIGNNLTRLAALQGLTPKSYLEFLDHVYGPAIVYLNQVQPPSPPATEPEK